MRVVIVPQLMDNYAYLIVDEGRGECAVVDPAEADLVEQAVAREGLTLVAILNTHHHWDHTGGNEALLASQSNLRVIGYAPDAARIPGITEPVDEGDPIAIGDVQGAVMSVPCHTSGHVAYRFGNVLFTGDTLFAAGCGRFFEGTAEQMHRALVEVIGGLPDDTLLYCGHEYTESNLRFAATVDPDNPAIAHKLRESKAKTKAGEPTIPTTLAEERTYNPFLRAHTPGIRKTVGAARPEMNLDDPIAVLGALRTMKDAF